MPKNCPDCQNIPLKNYHIVRSDDSVTNLFIYKLYECQGLGDKHHGRYYYCVLCFELLEVESKYNHTAQKHPLYYAMDELNSFDIRNFHLPKMVPGATIYLRQKIDQYIFGNNHLSLVTLDAVDAPEELVFIMNEPFSQLYLYDSYDNSIDSLIKSHVENNNHMCMFCCWPYDSLPTSKVVYAHIKNCGFVHFVRSTSACMHFASRASPY